MPTPPVTEPIPRGVEVDGGLSEQREVRGSGRHPCTTPPNSDVGFLAWCLDVTRDWALGRATIGQVEAASRAAIAHLGPTFSAPSRELLEARRAANTAATELTKAAFAGSDEEVEASFFLIGYFAIELGVSTGDRLGAPAAWGPALESNQGLIAAGARPFGPLCG